MRFQPQTVTCSNAIASARDYGVALFLLLGLALLFALSACSRPDPLVSGPANPPMWEATRGNSRLILIGSVHQLPPEMDWQDARVRSAIAVADSLILELPPSETDKVATLFGRMSHDAPVAPLDRRLGVATADKLRDWLGDSIEDTDGTESWALSLAFSSASAAAMGLSGDNGVESVLTRHFQTNNKPITGLETAEQQLELFNSIPQPEQDSMLARAVNEPSSARYQMKRILRAWAVGGTEMIAQLANEDLVRTPNLVEPLVLARNRNWADQLAAHPDTGKTILVAVGVGHLVGANNLLQLLSERGFTVRQLNPVS